MKKLFDIPLYALSPEELSHRVKQKIDKMKEDAAETDQQTMDLIIETETFPKRCWDYNHIVGYIRISAANLDAPRNSPGLAKGRTGGADYGVCMCEVRQSRSQFSAGIEAAGVATAIFVAYNVDKGTVVTAGNTLGVFYMTTMKKIVVVNHVGVIFRCISCHPSPVDTVGGFVELNFQRPKLVQITGS